MLTTLRAAPVQNEGLGKADLRESGWLLSDVQPMRSILLPWMPPKPHLFAWNSMLRHVSTCPNPSVLWGPALMLPSSQASFVPPHIPLCPWTPLPPLPCPGPSFMPPHACPGSPVLMCAPPCHLERGGLLLPPSLPIDGGAYPLAVGQGLHRPGLLGLSISL